MYIVFHPFSGSSCSQEYAVYNLKEMPRETALQFVRNVEKLADIAVVFEGRKRLDEYLVLHTLEEHHMETPASLLFMNLFVANSDESVSDLVDMFRLSMSDDGYILGTRVPSSTKTRSWAYFLEQSVLQRVCNGRLKVLSAPDFFRRFQCSCPLFTSWVSPYPILTMFVHHDYIRHEGYSMDHVPTLSYLLHILDPADWGLVRLPRLPNRAHVPCATPTELLLENESLPGLTEGFGRFQQCYTFGNHWIVCRISYSLVFFTMYLPLSWIVSLEDDIWFWFFPTLGGGGGSWSEKSIGGNGRLLFLTLLRLLLTPFTRGCRAYVHGNQRFRDPGIKTVRGEACS